ncbi:unnamed protein product [Dracunculus medinensis]|uniref:Uncharacterized protein n=1 Tax=Dracunculus medinensis TaxID=318479 RepID=A0A0N4UHS0_DRAME|nr:unnamed protein product [Dracunculus medinensis]
MKIGIDDGATMSENPNSWTLSEDIRKEREKNKIKANTFKFNADYSENNFLSHLSNADSVEKESKINTAEIPKTGSIFGGFGHGLTAKPFSDSLKSNFSEEHNNERGKSVENEDEATRKERDKQERDRLFWRRAAMHSSEFSPITASNPLSNVAKSNQLNQRFSRPLLENSAYKSPFAAGSSNSRPSWPRFGDPVADPPKHMELVASGRSFSQDRDGNKCLWNFDKNDFEKRMGYIFAVCSNILPWYLQHLPL